MLKLRLIIDEKWFSQGGVSAVSCFNSRSGSSMCFMVLFVVVPNWKRES